MANDFYSTGTAADIPSLLAALQTFLDGANWSPTEWIGDFTADGDYIVYSSPGSTTAYIQVVVAGVVTQLKFHAWEGWTNGVSGDPGVPGAGVGTDLTSAQSYVELLGAFPYWFFANEDRVIVVLRYGAADTDFYVAYAGLISTGDDILDTYPVLVCGHTPDKLTLQATGPVMVGTDGAIRRYPDLTYYVEDIAAADQPALSEAQPNVRGAVTKNVMLPAIVVCPELGFTEIRGQMQGLYFCRPGLSTLETLEYDSDYYLIIKTTDVRYAIAIGPVV